MQIYTDLLLPIFWRWTVTYSRRNGRESWLKAFTSTLGVVRPSASVLVAVSALSSGLMDLPNQPQFSPLLTRHWLRNFQRIRTHNDNSHRDVSMTDWDRKTTKYQVRQSRKFDLWNTIAEICSISFKVSFSLEETAELICVSGGWGPAEHLCMTTAKARSRWFQLFGCALGIVIWSRQNYLRVWWRWGRSVSKLRCHLLKENHTQPVLGACWLTNNMQD